jgi:hypothetical protein
MPRDRGYGGLSIRAQGCAHGCQDMHVTAVARGDNRFLLLPIVMTRRLSQRRRCDRLVREQLIDEAFARYLEWLTESEQVNAAYLMWSRAPRTDGALPFAAYGAALDREERAATVYRSAIDRIDQRFGGEERLAGARSGATRA